MTDLLQALLQQGALQNNQFPPTSRYYGIETATYQMADGRLVAYVKRRFLPPPEKFAVLLEHTVKEGERLDSIAAQYLGDPEQFWRLCDANEAMQPEALVAQPGSKLNITLPEGITGAQDA
jgi:LysM domain